jgi:hypothetical protein
MSLSTIVVTANAQLLRTLRLRATGDYAPAVALARPTP